jgi:cholesterol oxidase
MNRPRPAAEPSARRVLRLPEPEAHHVETEDGVTLRLIRYRGGEAGPVLFAPGNGITNEVALLDTIDCNLGEYLVERGHDLWLLDWRSSPEVDCPGYSLYDCARYDWRAALTFVTEQTGVSSVDCVGFCAGGMTLQIALAQGHLRGLVRSAVFLQSSLLFSVSGFARLKGAVRMADILQAIGWRTYRQSARGASGLYRLLDFGLTLLPVPREERCDSPSCRRMAFGYGQYVRHARLNDRTHDQLPNLLGASSTRSFIELGAACRKQQLMPLDETALDNLRLPITFIHSQQNQMLLPRSSARLYEALVERHGAGLYEHIVSAGYGHFDCLAGDDAARDIYPFIGAHLDSVARVGQPSQAGISNS